MYIDATNLVTAAPRRARPALDLSAWAVVAYNDDTGLGRMAQDIRAVLGVRQIVVPSQRLETKPFSGEDVSLRADAGESELEAMLAGLQGIIVLENPSNPHLLAVARRLDVRVVCVPMWEWFRGTDAHWALVDLFVCPSAFCLDVVRSYGWNNVVHLPWTLDLARLPRRRVRGKPTVFFHNAGLVDDDDRKGTRETIRAFSRVRRRDVRLIVRLQREAALGPIDGPIDVRVGHLGEPSELYAEGDVAIQPSKMEGLGLMVLEPVCCGVPTITTDSQPMSDYVRQPELRVRTRWFKRSAFPARVAHIRHAHQRLPAVGDLARTIAWCAGRDLEAISDANRAFAENVFHPGHLRTVWARALGQLLS